MPFVEASYIEDSSLALYTAGLSVYQAPDIPCVPSKDQSSAMAGLYNQLMTGEATAAMREIFKRLPVMYLKAFLNGVSTLIPEQDFVPASNHAAALVWRSINLVEAKTLNLSFYEHEYNKAYNVNIETLNAEQGLAMDDLTNYLDMATAQKIATRFALEIRYHKLPQLLPAAEEFKRASAIRELLDREDFATVDGLLVGYEILNQAASLVEELESAVGG
jgi:hypothetical protein